ncbi:MAG: aminotransferase class V-fold PLP-dependent enzyme [Firmicutes bacterium]|nr:aminotransferase class V-fold PLP-dependent enzyme [Bacillota bacterium]
MDPWLRFRQDIRCTEDLTYFNVGTMGPMPIPIAERLLNLWDEWNTQGPGDPARYEAWHDRVEETRRTLARVLALSDDRLLTLKQNVSAALLFVLAQIRLAPGSHLITSDEEHPALLAPLMDLARRGHPVHVIRFSAEDMLEQIRVILQGHSVGLIALSHVSHMTGRVVRAAELGRLARDHGVPLLLDGAQALAHVPLAEAVSAADFYIVNGQKWSLAPAGCAALVLAPGAVERLDLRWRGPGRGWHTQYPQNWEGGWDWVDPAQFESGTQPWPLWAVWKDALDYLEVFGWEQLFEHQHRMARDLAAALAIVKGVELAATPDQGTATVAIRLSGWAPEALQPALRSRGVVVRALGAPVRGIRLTVGAYNNEEDIRRAVDAVRDLAANGTLPS